MVVTYLLALRRAVVLPILACATAAYGAMLQWGPQDETRFVMNLAAVSLAALAAGLAAAWRRGERHSFNNA
jgi:hypothetical protein